MNHFADEERIYPHSPDVLERDTSDNGFSKGWGMHFLLKEETIVDMHGHIEFSPSTDADQLVKHHLGIMKQLNVSRLVACSPVMMRPEDREKPLGFPTLCCYGFDELKPYLELAQITGHMSLMPFLHHGNPDIGLLKQSIEEGACGVKLHNAPIIVEGADAEIWLSDEWAGIFSELGKANLSVLWHVTQRLTDCPYVGGERNAYWRDGWKMGVSYTNEDLLRIYLLVVSRYPEVRFISAHQLHIGWDRLASMFDQYENLYIDTSIGCWVNEGDRMHEDDIRYIREIFIRYSDRILFGTDYSIAPGGNGVETNDEAKLDPVKNHIRFIKQLRLPDEALQRVFHANAEKILGWRA